MPKGPDEIQRRVVLDARVNSVAERETEVGEFKRDIDTRKLRSLKADELALLDTLRMRAPKFNPYDTAAHISPDSPRAGRKTLDDLRRLSEEIKRSRTAQND
jgi:hypothetical protein